MISCVIKSVVLLFLLDVMLKIRGLSKLHDFVRKQSVADSETEATIPSEILCRSVDIACVFYFKQVMCLQRSAVTTVLLRKNGWPAEMVIGAQVRPFKSHAWVEIDGLVVNDKPYISEMYRELERC